MGSLWKPMAAITISPAKQAREIGQMRMKALLLEHEKTLEHEKLVLPHRGFGGRAAAGRARPPRGGEAQNRARKLGHAFDAVRVYG